MNFRLLLVIFFTCLLFSCEQKGESVWPLSYFTTPFPDKATNLEKVLGKSVVLTNGEDTLKLSIQFNKATKKTLIFDSGKRDTIFHGIVSKYKGIYYLSSMQFNDDSCYWITALKIKGDIIKGFDSERYQMHYMDSQILNDSNCVLNKTVDTSKPGIAMIPEKKILRSYFEKYVDSLPALKIVGEKKKYKEDEKIEENFEEMQGESKITSKFYPNPVEDILNIEFSKESNYTFILFNEEQKIILEGKFPKSKNTIDFTSYPSGVYFIKVINEANNKSETGRILVE